MQARYTGARWLVLGLIFASPFLPLLWFQSDCETSARTQETLETCRSPASSLPESCIHQWSSTQCLSCCRWSPHSDSYEHRLEALGPMKWHGLSAMPTRPGWPAGGNLRRNPRDVSSILEFPLARLAERPRLTLLFQLRVRFCMPSVQASGSEALPSARRQSLRLPQLVPPELL